MADFGPHCLHTSLLMPLETELKLAVHTDDLDRLLTHSLLAERPSSSETLGNTYFDTPDLKLHRLRIAVRERRQGGQTLLTVKTAGRSVAGLSRRHEWEGPTQPGRFDFKTLVDDATLAEQLSRVATDLVPVFQTDFRRRCWMLDVEGARVEVALDEGFISCPTRAQAPGEPILELELELKLGPEKALLTLAQTLAQDSPGSPPLRLSASNRSKAERGYALFLNSRA